MFDPGSQQQQAEQFQRIRADIKNILPIDLYEGMFRAGKLVTNLYHNSGSPDERKIKDFCEVFWPTCNFTRMKLDKDLVARIDEWFSKMTIPPRVDPREKKNTYLTRGIDLFNEFYNGGTHKIRLRLHGNNNPCRSGEFCIRLATW